MTVRWRHGQNVAETAPPCLGQGPHRRNSDINLQTHAAVVPLPEGRGFGCILTALPPKHTLRGNKGNVVSRTVSMSDITCSVVPY